MIGGRVQQRAAINKRNILKMPGFFDWQHVVTEDEIDWQDHVNNLNYLKWTLGAARQHSKATGWDAEDALQRRLGWVVRSHDITYKAAAVAGNEVIVRTWVAEANKFATRRKYFVCRPADRTVLARAETRWVYVDLNKQKLVPIPESVSQGMKVLDSSPGYPWE